MPTPAASKGSLLVTGTGPGALDLLAPRARQALEKADTIIGYRTYLELVESCFNPKAEVLSSSMMQEMDRCRKALELAESGQTVALVCGGDPGIYAMAGLVFELARTQEIFLAHRAADTPVGIVTSAGREEEQIRLCTLATMLDEEIGMQTTVTIGNSQTFSWQGHMVTPRGYAKKYGLS